MREGFSFATDSRSAGRMVALGIVAIVAILYVVVNFAVDLLYTALDPRIRNAR